MHKRAHQIHRSREKKKKTTKKKKSLRAGKHAKTPYWEIRTLPRAAPGLIPERLHVTQWNFHPNNPTYLHGDMNTYKRTERF